MEKRPCKPMPSLGNWEPANGRKRKGGERGWWAGPADGPNFAKSSPSTPQTPEGCFPVAWLCRAVLCHAACCRTANTAPMMTFQLWLPPPLLFPPKNKNKVKKGLFIPHRLNRAASDQTSQTARMGGANERWRFRCCCCRRRSRLCICAPVIRCSLDLRDLCTGWKYVPVSE
ncbi:hypothetical protein LY76DRAFT_79702 [Colletotrichum caudatum]|nr:hypothetical protein LY76DRAFT_79702 [Colletotrichum caudatum]